MAPIKPFWHQPSHPDILQVIVDEDGDYASKSISKVALAPFGVFAELRFPPCTVLNQPSYATLQMGRDSHLLFNSDLLYINHSCEPSLIFDMSNMVILAGPRGLQLGDELSFFYPSTEWRMSQPFDCLCGTPSCRGTITGASTMLHEQLQGVWLNAHIRELLAEQAGRSTGPHCQDPIAQALQDSLCLATKSVDAARLALSAYHGSVGSTTSNAQGNSSFQDTSARNSLLGKTLERDRSGPTSRELSGEMDGDTHYILGGGERGRYAGK